MIATTATPRELHLISLPNSLTSAALGWHASVPQAKPMVVVGEAIHAGNLPAVALMPQPVIGLFERLGIADAMRPRTVAFKEGSEWCAAVARGDVELGFNQIGEIVAEPRLPEARDAWACAFDRSLRGPFSNVVNAA
jgi:hypothetical protein